MGIYDREYFRRPPRRETFARVPVMSVTMWLIVICVFVFAFDRIAGRFVQIPMIVRLSNGALVQVYSMSPIEYWLHFSAYTVMTQHQIWRYVSFQFLHASFTHLLFNMIALYTFGPLIESYLGRRRYTAFYLLCGASGAALYMILWQFGFLRQRGTPVDLSAVVPLVGASAGIFGVLVAAAMRAPDAQIMLLFPPIPMKLRTLAWVFIAIAVGTVFFAGNNAGGEAAHLGGAFMGYALMVNPSVLNFVDASWWRRKLARRAST